jgi:hypothetical protein
LNGTHQPLICVDDVNVLGKNINLIKNRRVDLKEIGWEGVDWMHVAQDRDQ